MTDPHTLGAAMIVVLLAGFLAYGIKELGLVDTLKGVTFTLLLTFYIWTAVRFLVA